MLRFRPKSIPNYWTELKRELAVFQIVYLDGVESRKDMKVDLVTLGLFYHIKVPCEAKVPI